MIKKFGLEDSKPIKTPMSSKTKLTRDKDGESVDDTKYHGMIGSLLYLTASRSDIMFSVYLCAHFQEDPKTSHLEAVKRIFIYIKGTTHLGLWYPKGTGVKTIVYAYSDHAGDYVNHKSTSAEYISIEKACQQVLWMKQALIDYDIKLDDIPVLCNNKGAIDLNYQFPSLMKASSILQMEPAEPGAINLNPVKLIFSTPPTSPHPFYDSLEDLPPRTANPLSPQPSFETIERLANQPPPLPVMEPPLPPFTPHLPPLGSNNVCPILTHEIFCEHCLLETDIRQKDEKSSKNRQNRARNGKAWKSQSQVKAKSASWEALGKVIKLLRAYTLAKKLGPL
ncbi:hypothetical protein Tco_0756899 [Tanacetum coccineum]